MFNINFILFERIRFLSIISCNFFFFPVSIYGIECSPKIFLFLSENCFSIQSIAIETASKSIPSYILKELETPNEYLTDNTINYFIKLINNIIATFDMIDVLNYYFPENYTKQTSKDK